VLVSGTERAIGVMGRKLRRFRTTFQKIVGTLRTLRSDDDPFLRGVILPQFRHHKSRSFPDKVIGSAVLRFVAYELLGVAYVPKALWVVGDGDENRKLDITSDALDN